MRHGESDHNRSATLNETNEIVSYLTDRGKEDAKRSIKEFNRKIKIDVLYHSPLMRCRQTAGIVKDMQKTPIKPFKIDKRLAELRTGFNNQPPSFWVLKILFSFRWQSKKFNDGQSVENYGRSLTSFLTDISRSHAKKNVMVVAHLSTFQIMQALLKEEKLKKPWHWRRHNSIKTGEIKELNVQKMLEKNKVGDF